MGSRVHSETVLWDWQGDPTQSLSRLDDNYVNFDRALSQNQNVQCL